MKQEVLEVQGQDIPLLFEELWFFLDYHRQLDGQPQTQKHPSNSATKDTKWLVDSHCRIRLTMGFSDEVPTTCDHLTCPRVGPHNRLELQDSTASLHGLEMTSTGSTGLESDTGGWKGQHLLAKVGGLQPKSEHYEV